MMSHKDTKTRRWIAVLIALLIGMGLTVSADEDPEVFTAIERALATGRAEQMLEHVGSHVEISVMGRGTMYSKAQALYVMRAFFEAHPPRSFSFSDYTEEAGRRFAFGRYRSQHEEEPYQVVVYLREGSATWELREVRIEAPDDNRSQDGTR